MPKVSVITPVWADTDEKVDWLIEAIESVRSQSLDDWEMIVIDDQSPRSLEKARARFTEDKRVRFLRNTERSKPALTRNTGVALAESEALFPLDADDLLPDRDVLEAMHDEWERDKSLVIYGDLQRYDREDGGFTRSHVFNIPPYSFARTMDLRGTMPVSCLHSKECHLKAGGWKPQLDSGLEDVEYWIAAGLAGFCGHKIDKVTLLYRRHQQSRAAQMRHVERREGLMRNLIRDMHKDVFEGRYPMGCCGGGGRGRTVSNPSSSGQSGPTPRTLTQYPASEKVWVRYRGKRGAAFGMNGPFTKSTYRIDGQGAKLEVHIQDLSIFRRSGRGVDFDIGVPPPEDAPLPSEAPPEQEQFQAPEPRLSQVERLDKRAFDRKQGAELDALNLGGQREAVEAADWTVEKLADASINDLRKIKGIGPVRAATIINKAKELTGAKVG